MKLSTTIPPRRDGTVRARGLDGVDYVFVRGNDGDLECDIAHEETVAQLLSTGMFFPSNPEDFEAALDLEGANDDGNGAEDDPPPAPVRRGRKRAQAAG